MQLVSRVHMHGRHIGKKKNASSKVAKDAMLSTNNEHGVATIFLSKTVLFVSYFLLLVVDFTPFGITHDLSDT